MLSGVRARTTHVHGAALVGRACGGAGDARGGLRLYPVIRKCTPEPSADSPRAWTAARTRTLKTPREAGWERAR